MPALDRAIRRAVTGRITADLLQPTSAIRSVSLCFFTISIAFRLCRGDNSWFRNCFRWCGAADPIRSTWTTPRRIEQSGQSSTAVVPELEERCCLPSTVCPHVSVDFQISSS